MMGSKGEMVGTSMAPLIYITFLLNYLQIKVNSVNICLSNLYCYSSLAGSSRS